MTVNQLIEALKQYPPETRVLVYDCDSCRSFEPELGLVSKFTDAKWETIEEPNVEITCGAGASVKL